jgi:hypothetical protein
MTLNEYNTIMERLNEILERLTRIENEIKFQNNYLNEDKIFRLYRELEEKSNIEYDNMKRFRAQGDEYNESICEGEYLGLQAAMSRMEEYYPWIIERLNNLHSF